MPKSAMLFYDLDLRAWTRSAGSKSPPEITPVLTVGGKYPISVQFVRGAVSSPLISDNCQGSLNLAGDFTNDPIAVDSSPFEDGKSSIVFTLDLSNLTTFTYFADNPTESTVKAVFTVSCVASVEAVITAPLTVILQNSYPQ